MSLETEIGIALVPDDGTRIGRQAGASGKAPVTVAIVTFNRPHFLEQALRSCQDQTLQPEQIIVVDDGSSEDTGSVIERWNSLNIKYVNVGKIGLGNARNLATALCESQYVCILDDDDIMLPNRISDHMAALAGGAQVSHGGWINFTPRMELEYRPGKQVDEDVMVYVGAAMTHGACCYDTAVLREFPYRSDIVGEDYDLVIRVISSGVRCAHTGSYVLLRRRHGESISSLDGTRQDYTRHAVVSMINLMRTGADIERRMALGREPVELISARCPSLSEIYGTLGGMREPMRVVGSMPRAARDFFRLFRQLGVDWSSIDVIDEAKVLTATVGLACRATADVAALGAFEAALRKHSIKPAVVAARGAVRRLTLSMQYNLAPDTYRIALRSPRLKELYLSHRIISRQRRWTWYLVARREFIEGRQRLLYYLVSAPFEKRGARMQYEARIDEVKRFIDDATGLHASVVETAPPS